MLLVARRARLTASPTARTLAAAHLAGALLCAAFLATPVREEPSWVDALTAVLAAATGVALLSWRWSDERAVGLGIGAGVAFVVFVTLSTSDPRGDVFYLWPTLAAAHYLPWRRLVPVLAVEVGADLVFAWQRWPAQLAVGRWVTMSGALLVTALLVARLTARVRSLVAVLGAQALTDPLTGLPNRRSFDEALVRLQGCAAAGEVLAVLLLDLDDFKAVNDGFGHAAGDLLLQQVARRLVAAMRDRECVARLGGDEFVAAAVVPAAHACAAAEQLRARLNEALTSPVDLAGRAVRVRASTGIAVGTDRAAHPEHLLRLADSAMYDDKAGRRRRLTDLLPAHLAAADTLRS